MSFIYPQAGWTKIAAPVPFEVTDAETGNRFWTSKSLVLEIPEEAVMTEASDLALVEFPCGYKPSEEPLTIWQKSQGNFRIALLESGSYDLIFSSPADFLLLQFDAPTFVFMQNLEGCVAIQEINYSASIQAPVKILLPAGAYKFFSAVPAESKVRMTFHGAVPL